MDKIFREIKNAIEEEMRNAESGPPPGGGRSQAGGGRRAQEYAEWLKDEQDRLRGGGSPPSSRQSSQPPSLERVPVEKVPDEEWDPRANLPPQPEPRAQPKMGQGSKRQQRENQPRRPEQPKTARPRAEPRRATQQQRSQRRHDRQTTDAYSLRTAGQMGKQINTQLRSRNGLRQAFLLREIISKPVSLRDKDDHLIS